MLALARRLGGRPGAARVLRALAAAVAIVAVGPRGEAGDPDLAKFLLQHGKEALEKGKPDDALTKLQKAKQEDPSLVEVTYWIGAALEARGDVPGAVEQYRAYVETLAARAADAVTKELTALQKKAQARLDVLDAGRRDVDKAHEAFAGQVLEFAGRVKKDDPHLAARALRLLLALKPTHLAAIKLLSTLDPGTGDKDAPFVGLSDLWDLISSHGLGKVDGWTYVEDRIEIRREKGGLNVTPGKFDSGPLFAMELVVSRESIPAPGRSTVVGFTFGWVDNDGFTVLMLNDELALQTYGKSGRNGLVPSRKLPTWPAGARRTLAVRVDGQHVTVYVDGEVMLEHDIEARPHLAGNFGTVIENGVVTFHRLVLARPGKGGK